MNFGRNFKSDGYSESKPTLTPGRSIEKLLRKTSTNIKHGTSSDQNSQTRQQSEAILQGLTRLNTVNYIV